MTDSATPDVIGGLAGHLWPLAPASLCAIGGISFCIGTRALVAAEAASGGTGSGTKKTSPQRELIRFEIVDYNCKALSKVVPARHKDDKVFMYSGALAMGANAEVLTFPESVSSIGPLPPCLGATSISGPVYEDSE
jgi:hypothetical protein